MVWTKVLIYNFYYWHGSQTRASGGAVESVGINGSTPSTVKIIGSTSGITYKSVDATTPGSVHKAVAESGDKRVKVIKSLPQGNGNPNIEIKAPDKVILNHLKNSN